MANFNVNIISGSVELREGDLLLVNSESTINVRTELSKKENITNRAYSINADSTNTQYPVAKAVYDFVSSSVAEVPKVEEIWIRGTGSGSAVLSGSDSTASGQFAVAEGYETVASGKYSHAEGWNTVASGKYSHAEGWNTVASGTGSHAEGKNTLASGTGSHAEGKNTLASGKYSHAEGNFTTASGECSHAEGNFTTASGECSHAEGTYTQASGECSHAEGTYTTASNTCEHVQGKYNATASGQIFSVGVGNAYNSRKNAISIITGSGEQSSASIYIYGIDSYIGNNPVPGTNDLASVIAKISASAVPADLTGLFASASYSSDDKKIYFYDNNGTASGEVDATAFIKDGMVNTVTIDTGSNQMIITFNTDAGKEDIALDLTQIFNPNNYYTKTEVNTISSSLSASVAGKQDYFADVENTEDGVSLDVPGTGEYTFRVRTNDGEEWASIIGIDPYVVGISAGDFRTASAELSLVTEEENSPHVDLLLLDQRTSQRAFYQMGVDGIDLNQKQVHSLADPTSSQDAATKNYVDSAISNIPSVDTSSLVKNNQTGSWASASAWVTANSASALAVSPASVTASINAAIGAATASHHTHSNKAVLDGITAAKTASWDSKLSSESDPIYLADSASLKSAATWLGSNSASLLTSESDPVYLADSASLKASGSLAKNLTAISASLIASGTLAKNVTAITASLVASASIAKTASSSAAAISALTSSLVASASIAKTASSSAAAISAKTGSWDALVGLPTVTAADNGKILRVVNGAWALVDPVTVYSGQGAPDSALGQDGDIYLQS